MSGKDEKVLGSGDSDARDSSSEPTTDVEASFPEEKHHHQSVHVAIADEAPDFIETVPYAKQITVIFDDICAWVPKLMVGNPNSLMRSVTVTRNALTSSRSIGKRDSESAKTAMRQVLYNLSGECRPGEVLALMGPSGSGKTTLLSVVGARFAKEMKLSGKVTYNGKLLSKQTKRQVGFVLQDDLLYASLTVYETLYYAAMLRLPRTMTRKQKIARVEAVIDTLGLRKCKDTIIGGFLRRGISGGERKRVAVGHELVINPATMMLDEPTSGLDSTTAMRLVTTLRQLAAGGRSIVMTIHQPSSRLYQQLDKLFLLSEGHAMYYGQAARAADWFRRLGFKMPYGVNMADFILDLASGDVRTESLDCEEARRYLIQCQEAYCKASAQADVEFDGYGNGAELSEGTLGAELWQANRTGPSSFRVSMDSRTGEEGASISGPRPPPPDARDQLQEVTADEPRDRWGAPYWLQLQMLFLRAVQVRRFETLSTQDFWQFTIMGTICGLFWWQVGRGETLVSVTNINGLLFFEMLFLGLRAMFSALFTFPNEYKMMLKERASGMYRLSAFYFARTASDLPMEFTLPSIYIFIMYFMTGLRLSAGAFFGNWLSVMLVSAVSQSFGLLIGATVMVPKTAQTLTSVTMLSMMLVGGFYVNLIPVWIAWAKYISFLFYGYNLLLKVEYAGRVFYDCRGANPPHPATTPGCLPVPADQLEHAVRLQVNPNQWPWEVLALVGWLIFFRILVYVALRWKTRTAKP